MNLITLNIRGIGESCKIEWIRDLRQRYKDDFIGIQETRVSDSKTIDLPVCWGSVDFDHDAINPTGGSGGILSIWDSTIFRKSRSILTRNYIATTVSWKGFPGTTTIVNVYAPQSVTEKRSFWEDLTLLKSQTSGTWIFL